MSLLKGNSQNLRGVCRSTFVVCLPIEQMMFGWGEVLESAAVLLDDVVSQTPFSNGF